MNLIYFAVILFIHKTCSEASSSTKGKQLPSSSTIIEKEELHSAIEDFPDVEPGVLEPFSEDSVKASNTSSRIDDLEQPSSSIAETIKDDRGKASDIPDNVAEVYFQSWSNPAVNITRTSYADATHVLDKAGDQKNNMSLNINSSVDQYETQIEEPFFLNETEIHRKERSYSSDEVENIANAENYFAKIKDESINGTNESVSTIKNTTIYENTPTFNDTKQSPLLTGTKNIPQDISRDEDSNDLIELNKTEIKMTCYEAEQSRKKRSTANTHNIDSSDSHSEESNEIEYAETKVSIMQASTNSESVLTKPTQGADVDDDGIIIESENGNDDDLCNAPICNKSCLIDKSYNSLNSSSTDVDANSKDL